MDHSSPPTPIDGDRRKILTVRDLATGCTLAAHAVLTDDATSTIDILRSLCLAHRPPLVIKNDNGPAFTARETRDFFAGQRVMILYSPPYLPSYNGACEAGNGVIKHLAHDLASRNGRPGRWTISNERGCSPTAAPSTACKHAHPNNAFAERLPTTDADRNKLADAVRTARRLRCAQLAIASDNQQRSITADALERQAIADALLDTGILTIRSCRVRLPNQER